jgi:2,4-dienoyl-CoA reductase-like NADH-dependent reductase (Old Yellow Enzyme family)
MAAPFDTITIGTMTCSNRFARSATWEGMADEHGGPTERLSQCWSELARGGVGLVIAGHAYVCRQGQAGPWKLGLHPEASEAALADLVRTVHEAGGTLAAQLAHGGCRAVEALTGMDAIGAWPISDKDGDIGRAMTLDEIAETSQAFGRAAGLAKRTGFDAVQIHAAHGYLLSQFLSPFYNKRSDAYGGPISNRARLLFEVYAAVREAVGPAFPVLIKINSEDFLPGGFTVDEMIEVVSTLAGEGLSMVELSGGTPESGRLSPVRPGAGGAPYYLDAARRLKERASLPVMLVGGIRDFETAEAVLAEGAADMISLSRPLIREPDLVARWKSGDRAPSACVSDNLCFRPARAGEGIYCQTARREAEKAAKAAD